MWLPIKTMVGGRKPQTSGFNGVTIGQMFWFFFRFEKPHEPTISAIKMNAQVSNQHIVGFN